MTYSIFLSPQALKDLERIDSSLRRELMSSIEKLEEYPQYHAKKLKDIRFWSLRSGKYRIIFEIDDEGQEIRIQAIGHRKKIYKKF